MIRQLTRTVSRKLHHHRGRHPNSRPDLVFRYRGFVFFDEDSYTAQVNRQLRDGCDHFGAEFVGVRLIYTHDPSRSMLLTPWGALPLSQTPLAIDEMRNDHGRWVR